MEWPQHSLEWYNVGLDEVMFGNPDVVGYDVAFNWTVLDNLLAGTASRKKHAVFSFFIHWPGQMLHLPQYLLDTIQLIEYEQNNFSPYYGDEVLRRSLHQFINALGDRYDGDTRIYLLHLGLLGFWGEVSVISVLWSWFR